MSSQLIDKLKKSRQTNVEVDGKTFTFTRPTPMQAMEWLVGLKGEALSVDAAKKFMDAHYSLHDKTWRKLAQTAIERFVVDWPGMQEIDIVPGGVGAAIPFDRELFLLWVEDHPSTITMLGYHVFVSWLNYLAAQEADEKKSETGSSPDG